LPAEVVKVPLSITYILIAGLSVELKVISLVERLVEDTLAVVMGTLMDRCPIEEGEDKLLQVAKEKATRTTSEKTPSFFMLPP
jgi:hypothetical protein